MISETLPESNTGPPGLHPEGKQSETKDDAVNSRTTDPKIESNAEEQAEIHNQLRIPIQAPLPQKKKKAGMIHLKNAPIIDVIEARKLMMQEDGNAMNTMNNAASDEPAELESPCTPSNDQGEYLDASNEETFTLESFEGLIRSARSNNKSFILARVTTVDPTNNAHLYFSFYAAHHINRVIFRTQPEEGLLHRMKSRNPLNNMLIVGDVHYFVIRPDEFDRAWESRRRVAERREQQKHLLRSSVPALSPLADRSAEPVESSSSAKVKKNKGGGLPLLFRKGTFTDSKRASMAIPTAPRIDLSLMDAEEATEEESLPPLLYEAEYFASDDDFLMRSDIREFFKLNSVNPDDYQLFQLNRQSDLPYDLTVLGPDGQPLSHGSNAMHSRQPLGWRNLWGVFSNGPRKSLIFELPIAIFSPFTFWALTALLVLAMVFCVMTFSTMVIGAATVGAVAFLTIFILFLVDWNF